MATSLGLPCYVEKPPTLDWAELDKMIESLAMEVTLDANK